MNKKEHQALDASIPKCSCGNNLSRQRQENGVDKCPACDYTIDEPVVFDLDQMAWDRIKEAVKESTWMPEEYTMNDWVSDVCNFLKYGRDS